MRKLFKLLIPLLCFMPLFISAGTFEDGRKLANKYMEENFEDDYSRYIVSEDSKYESSLLISYGTLTILKLIELKI